MRQKNLAAPSRPRLSSVHVFVAFAMWWTVCFVIAEWPAAIIQSMAEAAAWGKEFQLGYNQHPPFWAWIAGLWFLVFPHTSAAFSLLSALNCAIGLWGAWTLIGEFAEGAERLAATALLVATPLYTFMGYGFNANIVFVSIWPWTLYFFVRAFRTPNALDSIAFGLMMGVALMSKYYALILGATCFLAALRLPERRAYFRSASPYISILVAAIVVSPHVYWLFTSSAPSLHYVGEITRLGYAAALRNFVTTLFGSIAENALPIAFILFFARATLSWPTIGARLADPRVQFLLILALAPLALSLAACLALQSKLVTPMLQGVFALVPLAAMRVFSLVDVGPLQRFAQRFAIAVTLIAMPLAPLQALYWVWFTNNPKVAEPRAELAAAATELWHERTELPLDYVGGSYALGDAVSFYSPDHPHSFESLDFARRLWVTPEALAAHGLLTLCLADDDACLAATERLKTPASSRTDITIIRRVWGRKFPPARFIATVIPPRT